VAALATAILLVALWVVVVAGGLEKTGKGVFIVPLQGTKTYPFSMFSPGHISEFVNQLLLLAPVGISLLLFFVFFKVKFGEFKNRLTNFLILAVSFALVYLFIFNFTLGSADWDLRSSPAVFLALLGVLTFLEWGERIFSGKAKLSEGNQSESGGVAERSSFGWQRYRAWGLVFIWLGLFHTVPWILVNASSSRAVARYVMIQEVDPHPVDESGYNLFKIKRILEWAGFPEEIEALFHRAIERDPYDTVSYYNLAAHYYRREEHLDRATLIADTLTKMAPGYTLANWLMANLLIKTEQPDKALPYLKRASGPLSGNVTFLLQLATAYYHADSLEEAADWASRLVALNPRSVDAYRILGMSQTRLGHAESAMEVWKHLLRIEPGDTLAVRQLQQLKAGANE
jgi:tetratricopeptide (TPR) repeat protein